MLAKTASMMVMAVAFSGFAGSLAHAEEVPTAISCKAFKPDEKIQSLKLSDDKKQIEMVAGESDKIAKLVIEGVEVQGTNAKVSGTVETDLVCAGSCGVTKFELQMSAGEIAPNSALNLLTSRFDEKEGRLVDTKSSTQYMCDFSGLSALVANGAQNQPAAPTK